MALTRTVQEMARRLGRRDRRAGDAVYISGYGLAVPGAGSVLGAWAAALPFGVLLLFDPGPLAAQIPAAVLGPVLARCDWLSCNEREAAVLAGAGGVAGW